MKKKTNFYSDSDKTAERFAENLFRFIWYKLRVPEDMIPAEKFLDKDYRESTFTEDIGMSVVCLQVASRKDIMDKLMSSKDKENTLAIVDDFSQLTKKKHFYPLLENYIKYIYEDKTGKSNIFLKTLLSCSVTAEIFILQYHLNKCVGFRSAPNFWLKYFKSLSEEFYFQGGWKIFDDYAHCYRKMYKYVENDISKIKKPYDSVSSVEDCRKKYYACILKRIKAEGQLISSKASSIDPESTVYIETYEGEKSEAMEMHIISAANVACYEIFQENVSEVSIERISNHTLHVDAMQGEEDDVYAKVSNSVLQRKTEEESLRETVLNLDLPTKEVSESSFEFPIREERTHLENSQPRNSIDFKQEILSYRKLVKQMPKALDKNGVLSEEEIKKDDELVNAFKNVLEENLKSEAAARGKKTLSKYHFDILKQMLQRHSQKYR